MTAPDLLIRRLGRAMATMDVVSRQVFLAHRLDGLSYADIAQRTGLPVADVERHIADAILHLDRELTVMERDEES
jgi:RNA polymerase sigma-70 factor (ECF subfamily)